MLRKTKQASCILATLLLVLGLASVGVSWPPVTDYTLPVSGAW
jgi:hypothetical protein